MPEQQRSIARLDASRRVPAGSTRRDGAAGDVFVASLVALFAIACSAESHPEAIESAREVALASGELRLHASTAERFGLRTPEVAARPRLAWELPTGWSELPATAMRAANFRVAGDERAECYLTLLEGDAGGLAANANRWRAQMSLPPASAEELSALEQVALLGREAVLLDLRGTWTGMSGTGRQAGYRLVGLLLVDRDGSAFLKMVGPDDVLAGQLEAFRSLAASFELGGDRPRDSGASDASGTAGGIAWKAPDGWRRAPERATRTASFYVGPGDAVECYVTVLGGDGGGALANLNRWRGQLGLAAASAEELAALPRIEMLGVQAILVELEGASSEAGLLGVLCQQESRAVFVKMNAPRAVVAAQREAFLAFCGSLTEAR